MADNLGIRLIAKLDHGKSVAKINKDLTVLASKLKNLDLDINIKGLSSELKNQVAKVNKKDKTIDMDVNTANLNKEFKVVSNTVEGLKREFGATTASVQKNIDAQEGNIKSFIVTLKKAGDETRRIRLTPEVDDVTKKTKFIARDLTEINNLEEERIKKLKAGLAVINKHEKTSNDLLRTQLKESDELDHQVRKAKELAKYKRQDLERRYGSVLTPDQNKQLDNYINSMNRITKDTPKAKRQIDQLNTSFKGIESQVKATGTKVNSFGANLKEALTRIPVWMIGMSAFYAPLRGLQNAVDQIIMLDGQMTELRRVMDATPQTYNNLMSESIALSSELGNKVEDVNNAMVN
ncbi:hypothetical protein [Aquibacillus saliphilus]|uniref:hypothetical protein n=1 Tax=Aquibacillus saliphilus TaxID=1909422 RepID=UPI001CF0C4F8|nr:hypothetical protein [Aquibacillus saliphilus]